ALLPQLRVAARDVRVLDLDIALPRAAEEHAPLVDTQPAPVPGEHRDLPLDAELGCGGRLRRLGDARLRLVDHRRARLDLTLGLTVGTLGAPRLHHPRRDPELADLEVVVGLEEDARRRQEGVVLAL